jgi:hypothetical protein
MALDSSPLENPSFRGGASLLMRRTLVLCFAQADRAEAYSIGKFLQLNSPYKVNFEEAYGARDFLETTGRALGGDVALLLASPNSVAETWKREAWETVLVNEARDTHTEVLVLMLAPCPLPALLKRTGFFDASADRTAALRACKRHLLGAGPAPSAASNFETLRAQLADSVGVAETSLKQARAFSSACAGDFETAVHVNCAHLGATGAVAAIGWELGMRLRGPYEDNLESLRTLTGGRRCLLVLENLNPELRPLLKFGNRTSVLFASSEHTPAPRPTAELAALFSSWMRHPEECLRALGELEARLALEPDPLERARLERAASALLTSQERFAEAFEMLDRLSASLAEAGDALGSYRARWDQSWILEQWGLRPAQPTPAPPSTPVGEQMALPF